jgi:hypothetical protein
MTATFATSSDQEYFDPKAHLIVKKMLLKWMDKIIDDDCWYDDILTLNELTIIKSFIKINAKIILDQQIQKNNDNIKKENFHCLGCACCLVVLKIVLSVDWEKMTGKDCYNKMINSSRFAFSRHRLSIMEFDVLMHIDWSNLNF